MKKMLARCLVGLVNATTKMQTVQVRLLANELKDGVEHFEPYGYTSNPKPGAEGLAAFLNGDRSHGVLLCIADRRFRLKELKPGEVALYTDEGDVLHFKRGRVIEVKTLTLRVTAGTSTEFETPLFKVKASTAVEFDTPIIRATGRIESTGDQVAGGVSQMNHPHDDTMPQLGAQSGPPIATEGGE